MKNENHLNDLMAIDQKLNEIQLAITETENALMLARVCKRKTQSNFYRGLYHHNIELGEKQLTQLNSQKRVFESGYNRLLNKF